MGDDNNSLSFGERKVFIKAKDAPESEWKELKKIGGSTTLVCKDDDKEAPFDFRFGIPHLGFTCTIKFSRKQHIKIGQMVGLLKRPKFTYKTIKRDCAKRNGRWTGQ